ncbi:MAG: M48 family metallopeptidase [Pseudomonadota bacterium]
MGLQTHIWNNNLKSVILLAIYPFILGAIVWASIIAFYHLSGFGTYQNISDQQYANNIIAQYWPAILGVTIAWFGVSFFFHTRLVRHMAHSHPVTRKEEPELYNLFENLCISIGMKLPKLEIIETHARNAFASGINDKTYTVTVTRGLLQSLSKDEVEAVLAHELTHILNRDVRLLIITIVFTGMIGFMAQLVWSQVRYSMWMGRRRISNNNKGNGVMLFLAIAAILWIGYLATLFTRFAISRKREYMADAGAVQMTKNPEAMMRALMRISGQAQIPKIPDDINMMCIENRSNFLGLFATHPPIQKRIESISATSGASIPDIPVLKPFNAPRAAGNERFQTPLEKRDNWATRQRFKNRRRGHSK